MDLTFGVEEHTFDGTSEVFTTVAQEVILPKLKRLFMDCFECHGVDLKDFLGNHPKLESLKLHNLNVIWHDSFSSVLGSLEKHHNLDFFWCWQIAEKWRRVIFRTWGDISVGDHQCIDCISDDRTCEDGDLIEVDRPKRLSAKAQASWENVAEKIGQLREDMEVTDRPMYLRDFEDHGFWYDQDLADDSDSD